jgi:Flp pilus assembly pilin Flp
VPAWDGDALPNGAAPDLPVSKGQGTKKGPFMRLLLKLFRDQRGVGAIEYVLVASLISVAAIAAFDELGGSVDAKFVTVEESL